MDFELCGLCWLQCNQEFEAGSFRIMRIAETLLQTGTERERGREREGGTCPESVQ